MFKIFVCLILIIFLQSFISIKAIANKPSMTLDRVLKDHSYIPVGETTFSILFWDLYKSKLLTTSGKYPIEAAHEKLIYQIHYLADISSSDLIKRTVEQWQYLEIQPEKYEIYLAMLEKMWPDIKDGDSLSLVVNNNKSVFYFNNKFIGEIPQPEFSQLFLDIWLSQYTSEPELRLELLGVNINE
jgi:hypothetical protein